MKNVVILVPESSVLQAIADPQYCLSAVNQFLISAGRPPLFHVQLVGCRKKVLLNNGQYTVHPDKLLKDVSRADIIFIPALFGNMETAVALNKTMLPWIVEQHKRGAEVASLCVGAFLLASTGLLNGKKCSTHWSYTDEFRRLFPEVEVQSGSIVTEETGIYSSGGANSYWNLLLHLVEKYTDRQTAILVAKYFAIDISRNSQSVFAMFKAQKNHQDEAVKMAQEIIENRIENKITVEELAEEVAVGRRSFERRFKEATHNSVMAYVQRVKIEVAKRSLENGRKNVNEVMFDVGYTDTKAFRNTFKKITGLSPVAYRNRYSKPILSASS